MSPRFPTLSPKKVIRAFERLGFEILRQKGSHVFLYKPGFTPFPIPVHNQDIKKGLLLSQLNRLKISTEDFLAHYK